MKESSKKYGVSAYRDAEQWTGLFDSVEIALQKGPLELGLDSDAKEIFIGEAVIFQPVIDASGVLENLLEQCADEVGEASDLWSPHDAGKPAIAELESSLNAALQAWLTKHNQQPLCYTIANIERHELTPKES